MPTVLALVPAESIISACASPLPPSLTQAVCMMFICPTFKMVPTRQRPDKVHKRNHLSPNVIPPGDAEAATVQAGLLHLQQSQPSPEGAHEEWGTQGNTYHSHSHSVAQTSKMFTFLARGRIAHPVTSPL